MLLSQVKLLASLYIFATTVACQVSPGTYKIKNRALRTDVLTPESPSPTNADIVVRPDGIGPEELENWNIIPAEGRDELIRNVLTGEFLSIKDNQAFLSHQPYPWAIISVDEGYYTISSRENGLALNLDTKSNPPTAVLAPRTNSVTERWVFNRLN